MGLPNLYISVILGLIGAALMATSDWLMVFGDPKPLGSLSNLTVGAASIDSTRLNIAMAIAIISALVYGIALFGLSGLFREKTLGLRWIVVAALSMTPWLCLHFLYICTIFLLGQSSLFESVEMAVAVAEAFFAQFSWMTFACVVIMSVPFFYFPFLVARGKSILPRWMAFSNPFVFCLILFAASFLIGSEEFRLAFTNAIMNEALFLWFLVFLPFGKRVQAMQPLDESAD